MLAAKGELEEAQGLIGWLSDQARSTDMSWVRAYWLVAAVVANFELGRFEAVRELLRELADQRIATYMEFVPVVVRAAVAVESLDLSACPTKRGTRCLARAAAWWRSARRQRRPRRSQRPARSSLDSAPSRRWLRRTNCC